MIVWRADIKTDQGTQRIWAESRANLDLVIRTAECEVLDRGPVEVPDRKAAMVNFLNNLEARHHGKD